MAEPSEENVRLLIDMGFADAAAVRRALRIAKNDVSEATALLTNETPGLDMQLDDAPPTSSAPDDPAAVAPTSREGTPADAVDGVDSVGETGGVAEFPMTHLYDLESRIFCTSWSVPYAPNESLGRCLKATTALAREQLCDADDGCAQFRNRALPACFDKLLTSHEVQNKWSAETLEGIVAMVELFVELVCVRVAYEPLPHDLLKILCTVFDSSCNYHQKTKAKQWDRDRWSRAFGRDKEFAFSANGPVEYGHLVNAVNHFANNDGFQRVADIFQTKALNAQDMFSLLSPFVGCASHLNREVVAPYLKPCCESAVDLVRQMLSTDMKSSVGGNCSIVRSYGRSLQCVNYAVDLVTCVSALWDHVSADLRRAEFDDLRLAFILKLLKSPHFGARMQALKEVSKILDSIAETKRDRGTISTDTVSNWLSENRVLSVALEGNIDQLQYVERLKTLLSFLGSRLSRQEISKIWSLRRGRAAVAVDNVFHILAQAAAKFGQDEIDHLLSLIEKGWCSEEERGKERIVQLLGAVGRDTSFAATQEKIAAALWRFANADGLPRPTQIKALQAHLSVVNEHPKHSLRTTYIAECLNNLQQQQSLSLPSIWHMRALIENIKSKSNYSNGSGAWTGGYGSHSATDRKRRAIEDLCGKQQLIETIVEYLVKAQAIAAAASRTQARTSTPELDAAPLSSLLLVQTGDTQPVSPSTRAAAPSHSAATPMPDGEAYATHVDGAFSFLLFVLNQGSQTLSWQRAKYLWETMVDSDTCSEYDKEECIAWFFGLGDLDMGEDARQKLLMEKLLRMNISQLSMTGLKCFRKYFESVNRTKGKLKSIFVNKELEVDEQDLVGVDYVWEVALGAPCVLIANEAIRLLIELSYGRLSARLRKDAESLHRRFLDECSRRLESSLVTLKGSVVGRAICDAAKTLTAVGLPRLAYLPPGSHENVKRRIERLLQVAARYICTVEADFRYPRQMPPHGCAFFGPTFTVAVTCEVVERKDEWCLVAHENETLRCLRERIAARMDMKNEVLRVELDFGGVILAVLDDEKLLARLDLVPQVGKALHLTAKRKFVNPGGLVPLDSKQSIADVERTLPSAVMISGDNQACGFVRNWNLSDWEGERRVVQVFELLYELAALDDAAVNAGVRHLLLLVPTDPAVSAAFDHLARSPPPPPHTNSLERNKDRTGVGPKERSPKLRFKKGHSPKPSRTDVPTAEGDACCLQRLFDPSKPFVLLYNLEVLSSRLLPTVFDNCALQSASSFCSAFTKANGFQYLLKLLKSDALPVVLELEYRQQIYARLLQILCFLLCNQSELHEVVACEREAEGSQSGVASASTSSAAAAASSSSTSSERRLPASFGSLDVPHCQLIAELAADEHAAVLSALQRLAWSGAAGMIGAPATCELRSPNTSGAFGGARTSESSTGSGDDAGVPTSIHAAVLAAHTAPAALDVHLAKKALQLLIDCALLRPNGVSAVLMLPHFDDFLLDLLLFTSDDSLRHWTASQFYRLAESSSACVVCVGGDGGDASGGLPGVVRRFVGKGAAADTASADAGRPFVADGKPYIVMLNILLRARLPLWANSSAVRGSARRLLGQCGEYFSLRCQLLDKLTPDELAKLQPSLAQMLEDEANWLLNFSCSADATLAATDGCLLAGHMLLIRSLLALEPAHKPRLGVKLIRPLVDEFLFPAARLMKDAMVLSRNSKALRQFKAANIRAKAQQLDGRHAAYALVAELCDGCPQNFAIVADLLTDLHHEENPDMAKEWDYQPLVEQRIADGYVGLKNAGATCYMNAVIQQFYMQPGLADAILALELDEDDAICNGQKTSLLMELQRVFVNLRESDAQYFTPTSFWDVFRLWGEKVNPREQQDAFEFYTCVIDQLDSELKKRNHDELFRAKYRGVFADQKICNGCPHRFEREEAFFALNLPLRAHGLEESLHQFVKGELLEGENAYLCEKCNIKRTTLKRLSIKTLPPILSIQLKRFDYDWEESRSLKFNDHFQFPRTLDMRPFTLVGLESESVDELFETSGASTPYGPSAAAPRSAGTTPIGSPLSGGLLPPPPPPSTHRLSQPPSFGRAAVAAPDAFRYDLVGVVVHSGQASAGHYYAFIKERRQDQVLNGGKYAKWYKFNDNTVEEVEMSDTFMEVELFGGRYSAKKEQGSFFPEERERYWNAYMLFYEQSTSDETGRQAFPSRQSASKRSISVTVTPCSTPITTKFSRRRDSFGELAALVEMGERQKVFQGQLSSIPQRLRDEVGEQNMRFSRDRDIFNADYLRFVADLVDGVCALVKSAGCDVDALATSAIAFVTRFLLNLCWHTRRALRGDCQLWVERCETLLTGSVAAARSLLRFVGVEPGTKFLRAYLFDCDVGDVRRSFVRLLLAALRSSGVDYGRLRPAVAAADADVHALMSTLVSLVRKEAADHWQQCGDFFHLVCNYAAFGPAAGEHLLQLGALFALLNFMVQMPQEGEADRGVISLSRRWSLTQSRDFGAVYNTIATMILYCDLAKHATVAIAAPRSYERAVPLAGQLDVLECPPIVVQVVYGRMMDAFVRELIWALTNVYNTCECLTELVLHAAYCNERFSRALIAEVLVACERFGCNDLRRPFALVEELLALADSLSLLRTTLFLDGGDDGAEGLLALVERTQQTDARRSYFCFKLLVRMAREKEVVKQAMNDRLDKWQWAVDWLRDQMDNGATAAFASSGTATYSAGSTRSNEDVYGRGFQRTVSAQYTLDNAAALLNEFESGADSPPPPTVEPTGASPDSATVEVECSDDGSNPATDCASPPPTGNSKFYVNPKR